MNDEALNEESRIIASFKKGKKLTIEQKIFLVKQKVHLGKTTKAVAALTGVSQPLIHYLAKDYEANANWMMEMEQKMEDEAHDDQELTKIIRDEVRDKRPFFSVASIKERAHCNGMEDVDSKTITTKLKKDFGMSYRKAAVISHLSNVEKNRIIRQIWAIKFLQLLESDVELWNVDQSAITSMHVSKRGWFHKSEPGHVSGRQMKNRINLTVAISTRGRCYFSMHHEKNNTPAVVLFFKHLFILLE